ncbi:MULTISPECIES: hypothetical protein [Symbiopectobacterium]|uniref:hypothetical protein n=1 Tax=Symbiopectobacterium TaxID=801 RepID=UPI00207AE71D|nr:MULTISPECIES: hypothetical protein [Symbiopectobacterium]
MTAVLLFLFPSHRAQEDQETHSGDCLIVDRLLSVTFHCILQAMSTHSIFVDSNNTMAVNMKDNIHSVRRVDKDHRPDLLKNKWQLIWHDYKVGVIPLPLFILAGGLVALNCVNDTL